MPLVGGVGAESEATAEVQALCDQVRADVQARANENGHEGQFQEFVAVKHKTQVVAGTNYFVKIHVGGGSHLHARIYRDLQGAVSLAAVQVAKTEQDSIEYFG